jgi:hypothetical protein
MSLIAFSRGFVIATLVLGTPAYGDTQYKRGDSIPKRTRGDGMYG